MDRHISQLISQAIERQRVVIVVGQRQVGKTYELRRLQEQYREARYFDFEDRLARELFVPIVEVLERVLGDREQPRWLLLDEIQYLPESGSVLKLIHDHFPETRVVATGSASFLMLKDIGDSLYGRHTTLEMHPLTLRELVGDAGNLQLTIGDYPKVINRAKVVGILPEVLVYGSLPAVHLAKEVAQKRELLETYVKSLLFKDVFEIEGIRRPEVFKKLLTLLAFQIGSEVNSNELGSQLDVDRKTILEYIGLYEKFRLVTILRSYSSNQRNEVKKGFKVYFVDMGIRNALIGNFVDSRSRTDRGGLFENLVVNMWRRHIDYFVNNLRLFYWRSTSKAEVDLVIADVTSDQLIPIEVKYQKQVMPSKSFVNKYATKVKRQWAISSENLWKFI